MYALRLFAKTGGEQSNPLRNGRYQSQSERVPSQSKAPSYSLPHLYHLEQRGVCIYTVITTNRVRLAQDHIRLVTAQRLYLAPSTNDTSHEVAEWSDTMPPACLNNQLGWCAIPFLCCIIRCSVYMLTCTFILPLYQPMSLFTNCGIKLSLRVRFSKNRV